MVKKLADSKFCTKKNFQNLFFKLLTTFTYAPWMISKLSTSMSCPWSQLSGDIIFSSADQVDHNKIFIYCLKILMSITFVKISLNKSWPNFQKSHRIIFYSSWAFQKCTICATKMQYLAGILPKQSGNQFSGSLSGLKHFSIWFWTY